MPCSSGEFEHHFGNEITFGQGHGALRMSHVTLDALSDESGDGRAAAGLVRQRAQLLLEDYAFQLRYA